MSHYSEQFENDGIAEENRRREFLLEFINEHIESLDNNALYKVKVFIQNIDGFSNMFETIKEIFR